MKTNAIVRIILLSLTILILVGILITVLAVDRFIVRDGIISNDSTSLPVATDGFTNTAVADASQIQNIAIEWAAGSIRVQPDPDAVNITVSEINGGKEKYSMVCRTIGDALRIQFCEDSVQFPSFGINVDISKDLVITVPEGWVCGTLEVDAASASLNVIDLSIRNMDFDGASGICVFDNCSVDTLDVDTASGDVNFTGTLGSLECDAVSANFRGVFDEMPTDLSFDGVSGDMDLTFPEDCGFTVALDSLSGNFTSEFPTNLSNDHHVYGDGSCRIEADGVSGSITIRNGGTANSVAASSEPCTIPGCSDSSQHHSEKHH